MNIFVAKLSSSTTSEDLQALFSEFGEVTKASVILDRDTGEPRGFGFVDMPDADSARNAIKTLDGASIQGRNIVVKEADDRRNAGASGGWGYQDGGNRNSGERGGYAGGGRSGSNDRPAPREGGYRPAGDRGGDRGGYSGGDRGGERGGDRGGYSGGDRGSERGGDRPFDRGADRGGGPAPFTPNVDSEFRKPARISGKGKGQEKKRDDWERRGTPKKSAIPQKKTPKKGRSFEDFDDDY